MAQDPARQRRWPLWLALGLASLLVSHSLLFTVYQVEGASMEPTLHGGQRVWGLRHFSRIKRGDVVLFRSPLNPAEVLVKRVVASAGDRLWVDNEKLYVDSFLQVEPYVKPGTATGQIPRQQVPEGHLFVLGDNRAQSQDSRQLGSLAQGLVIAKVVWAP